MEILEILESETEVEQHGLYGRLVQWKDRRYAIEVAVAHKAGDGHHEEWNVIGGSVGYDSSVFQLEDDAREYFQDLTTLNSKEMWEKYGERGLWVTA